MKLIITLFLLSIPCTLGRLSVSGGHLLCKGERVFLSGVNFAWNHYGQDFGNGWYNSSRSQFESWFKEIESAGGNAVRVWVHTDKSGPHLDASGHATGSDVHSYITEIGEFLDSAQRHGIFILLTIWNGDKSNRCYDDELALDAYINKFLTPLVKGLKGKPSVIYEIANEVNAVIHVGQSDSNKCYDTTPLANTGEGWTGN
jgi:mannan endo-1,4-beta-mannosidase